MKKIMMFFAVVVLMIATGSVQADLIINVREVGTDVVATYSGDLDLTDLSFDSTITSSFIFIETDYNPDTLSDPRIFLGEGVSLLTDVYTGGSWGSWTTPGWGPGAGSVLADFGTGGRFGFVPGAGFVYVPEGYVSGSTITGSSTWQSTTLAGIGADVGSYTYSWGSGGTADFIQINFVPTPGAVLLGMLGLSAVGIKLRKFA